MKSIVLIQPAKYQRGNTAYYQGRPTQVEDDVADDLLATGYFRLDAPKVSNFRGGRDRLNATPTTKPAAVKGPVPKFKPADPEADKTPEELEAMTKEELVVFASDKLDLELALTVSKPIMLKSIQTRQAAMAEAGTPVEV